MDILAVDDEISLLDLMKSILEDRGHTVAISSNVKGALQLLSLHKFDIGIFDLVIPGSNLDELFGTITRLRLPVIITSGLPKDCVDDKIFDTIPLLGYFQKPFSFKELALTVESLAFCK